MFYKMLLSESFTMLEVPRIRGYAGAPFKSRMRIEGHTLMGLSNKFCSSCLTWTFEDSNSCCVNLQCFAGPKYAGIIQKSSCVIGVPHFICAFWLKRR